jgi:hypothetical protein
MKTICLGVKDGHTQITDAVTAGGCGPRVSIFSTWTVLLLGWMVLAYGLEVVEVSCRQIRLCFDIRYSTERGVVQSVDTL